ncbi:PAS domain S-box protein [Flaviaesturariibacter amylovorans]|uniref:Oxygen sensor histidine kinase NreB n=1 Tax=Flaviaesturariibacter amylovorans TaxID=1084520 RepID=A0ABP8HH40_9BACT
MQSPLFPSAHPDTAPRYPTPSQLQQLFDSSPDVICSIDGDGRFVLVSRASLQVWGYAPEELIGRAYMDYVIPEDHALTVAAATAIMSGTDMTDFQNRYRRKDGAIIPILWSARWDEAGQTMFCIAKDASEKLEKERLRSQLDTEIRRQHHQMQEMLGRIADGFFSVDHQWVIQYANPRVQSMLGINVADYIGRNLWESFPSVRDSACYEQYHEAIRTHRPVHFEVWLDVFGKWFSVDAHPSSTGLSIFFRDTTQQKATEEELRRSHERFALAAKSDAIYDWDLMTDELQWGDGLHRIFGYHPDELRTTAQWEEALHPANFAETTRKLRAVLANESASVWEATYRLRKKDGNYFIVHELGHIVRDGSGAALRMVGKLNDITEKRRAELERRSYGEQLRNQHASMVAVLEQMNDGFITTDLEGRILYWNKEAERMTGIPRSAALGQLFPELYSGFEESEYAGIFRRLAADPTPVHRIIFSPFTRRWMELHAYVAVQKISVFFRDISEQKRSEEELRMLSLIARQTTNAVSLLDTAFRVTWINGAYTKLFGFTEEEALGRRTSELLAGPRTDEAQMRAFRNALEAGHEFVGEFVNYNKDGAEIITECSAQPVHDAEGAVLYYFMMMTDITGRRRREEELRLLSMIATEMEDGVVIITPDRKTTWVNAAFTRMTGYTLEEMLGRTPASVLEGPAGDPELHAFIREQYRKAQPFRVEVLNYKKNGEPFWSEMHVQPLFDADGAVELYFSIRKDITARKQLEQELEEQRKRTTAAVIEAQEAERSAVSQELHDNVNQVLTTVKLYQELCLSGIGDRDELTQRSIRLLQESITAIRSLSKRLSAPSLGKIRLEESVRELTDAVAATGKIQVALDTEAIEQLEVDGTIHLAVYRILQEGLTNVLKHAQATRVSVSFGFTGERLLVLVSDNGCGFDPGERGGGIGLSNIRTRVESLAGAATCDSAPGAGCTLRVELPV